MDAFASAGHDLLSFINASPTRKSAPNETRETFDENGTSSFPRRQFSQAKTRQSRIQLSRSELIETLSQWPFDLHPT